MEGEDAMAVHWATSESPAGPWTSEGVLFRSYRYRGVCPVVGRGRRSAGSRSAAAGSSWSTTRATTPRTGRREYDLSAALLDFSQDDPVRARIEPLMRPTGAYETEGDDDLGVDNVLFACANHRWGDRLVLPYAGADSRIFGATLPFEGLVAALEAEAA